MNFICRGGVVSLNNGEEGVFRGLRAYLMTEEGCRTYLPYTGGDGTVARFADETLGAFVELSLVPLGVSTLLRIKASYHPESLLDKKGNLHFLPEHAAGVEMEALENTDAVTVIYRRFEYWCRTAFPERAGDIPDNGQALLLKRTGGYAFAAALCDARYKGTFAGGPGDGLSLYVWDNAVSNDCDTAAAVIGFGEDMYALVPQVIREGFRAVGRPSRLREEREYPPVLERLGWCSWDAYHLEVSHAGLLEKAEEFREKGIPVHWFMLDDMWGHVKNNALGVNSTRELYSFEADPVRFPKGLAAAVRELKERYRLAVGLWHPTTGYWHGIDPQGEIAADPAYKDLLFWSQEGALVPSFRAGEINAYYQQLYRFYADCGIDFVKVDNQACLRRYAKRVMPIGQAARNLHRAVESSAGRYFGGQIINCMGMTLENFWNRDSAVSRMSCDYLPDSRERFNLQLLQNSFNSLVQGSVYYGDWDMWWSYDSQALKNAAAHAVSGGPVYISDQPGKSRKEVILPLLFSDGRVIRLENPARPALSCLFGDPQTAGRPYKIFNREGENGVVVAYNVTPDGTAVEGGISPLDAGLDPDGVYCAYDRFSGEAAVLRGTDSLPVALSHGDDFRMVLFVPVRAGRAVIGLRDKYVCFAGIRDGQALDDGEVLLYGTNTVCLNGVLVRAKPAGGGLYGLKVERGDRIAVE